MCCLFDVLTFFYGLGLLEIQTPSHSYIQYTIITNKTIYSALLVQYAVCILSLSMFTIQNNWIDRALRIQYKRCYYKNDRYAAFAISQWPLLEAIHKAVDSGMDQAISIVILITLT